MRCGDVAGTGLRKCGTKVSQSRQRADHRRIISISTPVCARSSIRQRLERLANVFKAPVESREGCQHPTRSEGSNAVREFTVIPELYYENATEDVVEWLSSYAWAEVQYMVLQETLLCFGEVLWAIHFDDENSIPMYPAPKRRSHAGTRTQCCFLYTVLEDLAEDPKDPEVDPSDDTDWERESDPEQVFEPGQE
ncbi:hypothetical protein NMY22_g6187 [Coprinellus aureogranulatus]|nr:hypothetical protein NMY22_g6187 [Coprinellus aureogranulatus]